MCEYFYSYCNEACIPYLCVFIVLISIHYISKLSIKSHIYTCMFILYIFRYTDCPMYKEYASLCFY